MAETRAGTRKWQGWKFCVALWLGMQLVLGLAGWGLWKSGLPMEPADPRNQRDVPVFEDGLRGALLGVWLRWDGIHYYKIAEGGYSEEYLTAYFPLYPLAAGAAGELLGGDTLLGLLLVSRAAALAGLILLYRIAAYYFGEERARGAVAAAALFPTAHFYLAPYPHGLALALTLGSFYAAIRRRWLLSGVLGLAAGVTHSTIVPLAAGLAVVWGQQWLEDRRWNRLASLPAAGMPVLGSALFLAWRAGMGYAPLTEIMFREWERFAQAPWMVAREVWRLATEYPYLTDSWFHLGLYCLAVGVTVWLWRKLPAALLVYQVVYLLFISSTSLLSNPFGSTGRYLLLMFPLFIGLGVFVRRKGWRLALVGMGLFLQIFLCAVYFLWGWFA